MRSRSWLAAALLVVALVPVAASGASAGAVQYTFDVTIGSACVSGTASPNEAPLLVTLNRSNGSFISQFVTNANNAGKWGGCFQPGQNTPQSLLEVKPGKRVLISGNGGRIFNVPQFSLGVKRGPDMLGGKAPDGEKVHVGFQRCFNLGDCEFPHLDLKLSTTTNGTGDWVMDTTASWNIRGNQLLHAHIDSTLGDHVRIERFTPNVDSSIGSPFISGHANPGQSVLVRMLSANGAEVARLNTTTDYRGSWEGLLKQAGSPVHVTANHRILANFADVDLRVRDPNIHTIGNTFHGQCAGSQLPFSFHVFGNSTYSGFRYGNTQADGTFAGQVTHGDPPQTWIPSSGDDVMGACLGRNGDLVSWEEVLP